VYEYVCLYCVSQNLVRTSCEGFLLIEESSVTHRRDTNVQKTKIKAIG
jgi:hypothetical protein